MHAVGRWVATAVWSAAGSKGEIGRGGTRLASYSFNRWIDVGVETFRLQVQGMRKSDTCI